MNEELAVWVLSQEAVAGWVAFVKRQRKGREASGIRILTPKGYPNRSLPHPKLPQLWPLLNILS